MDIQEQFNRIAREYDGKRKKFIPCFDDFYERTTRFIAENIKPPRSIADLGAGTGLLTGFWYAFFPKSRYVLVDVADEMLEVAKKRFSGIAGVSYSVENYLEKLPDSGFDAAISALSIHHLADHEKERLFRNLHDRLPDAGIFVNYDQFCAENAEIDRWYNSSWEKWLYASGLSPHDLALWQERRKLDRECSVAQEIALLKQCGFAIAECVFSSRKFSVIIAVKQAAGMSAS